MDKVILASASPRRRELLQWIVQDFEVIPSEAEEILPDGIPAEEQAVYLADQKAADVFAKNPQTLVIGSDTTVICDGRVLGKPKNKQDAAAMLRMLSGRVHKVITGCVIYYKEQRVAFTGEADVEFYALSDQEIEDYIAEGECWDKAGAYGIQSKGALLIKGLSGDYYAVVGFPVAGLKREVERIMHNE